MEGLEINKDIKQANFEEYLEDKILEILSRHLGKILNFPLSVKQVAELTGKTEHNIYKMCERGILPHTKVGRSTFINLRHLSGVLYHDTMSQ